MEKLCIKCNQSGTFIKRTVTQLVKGELKEYHSERNTCNKCLYKEKIERENLRLIIYG
jgi:hypothetical protein